MTLFGRVWRQGVLKKQKKCIVKKKKKKGSFRADLMMVGKVLLICLFISLKEMGSVTSSLIIFKELVSI